LSTLKERKKVANPNIRKMRARPNENKMTPFGALNKENCLSKRLSTMVGLYASSNCKSSIFFSFISIDIIKFIHWIKKLSSKFVLDFIFISSF